MTYTEVRSRELVEELELVVAAGHVHSLDRLRTEGGGGVRPLESSSQLCGRPSSVVGRAVACAESGGGEFQQLLADLVSACVVAVRW